MSSIQSTTPDRGGRRVTGRAKRWGVIALVVFLVAAGSTVAVVLDGSSRTPTEHLDGMEAGERAWASTSEPAEDGHRVTAHITAFTADGTPIRTTSFSTAVVLNRTFGLELFNTTWYGPGQFVLGSGDIGLLGPVVESYLRGAVPGDRIITDVIPAEDTVTGPDGEPVHLNRRFGPFPLMETVPTEKFQSRFPNATVGDVVQLNPRFYAQVEAMDDVDTTYRYLVNDGDTVPMPVLGPTATLTVEVDGDVFYDVASVEEGSTFQRRNDRVLNITHGPYLVEQVLDDEIVLQCLKAPLYDVALQDVFFVIEVLDVEQEAVQ